MLTATEAQERIEELVIENTILWVELQRYDAGSEVAKLLTRQLERNDNEIDELSTVA